MEREIMKKSDKDLTETLDKWLHSHSKWGLQQQGICTKGKFKAHTSLFGEESRVNCKELYRCNYRIVYGNRLIDKTGRGWLVANSTGIQVISYE